jgi:hypothetical protein
VYPNPAGATVTDEDSIPIKYLCSNARTSSNKGNLKSSTSPLTVVFSDSVTKKVICQESGEQLKNTLLNEKRLLIPDSCPKFDNKNSIKIELFEKENQNFIYSSTTTKGIKFSGNSFRSGNRKTLYVLADVNMTSNLDNEIDSCDKRASPLFVDLGGNEDLMLSPPLVGIKFDILGRKSFPVRNEAKQISWFTSDNFAFLVKPNLSGKVTGVDQMFGDNTFGPDGHFSANGFAALSKHDLNFDGIINSKDQIFQDLRLWTDSNGDGIAEPGELFYLTYMNIEAIDLDYDPDYYEKDIYGNEVRYKSVIKFSDGSVRLLFDLWFRYL